MFSSIATKAWRLSATTSSRFAFQNGTIGGAAIATFSTQTGTVKWFDSRKGYGFIIPDGGGDDVFVHQACIHAQGFRSLGEGEPVEYTLGEDPRTGRIKAQKVTGPNGDFVQGAPRRTFNSDGFGGGFGGGGFGGGYGGGGGGGFGGASSGGFGGPSSGGFGGASSGGFGGPSSGGFGGPSSGGFGGGGSSSDTGFGGGTSNDTGFGSSLGFGDSSSTPSDEPATSTPTDSSTPSDEPATSSPPDSSTPSDEPDISSPTDKEKTV